MLTILAIKFIKISLNNFILHSIGLYLVLNELNLKKIIFKIEISKLYINLTRYINNNQDVSVSSM